MKYFYSHRDSKTWSIFNCYPFFLDCKQTWVLTKIMDNLHLEESTLLDIGAGEGNFILKMISFGIKPQNIVAVEYLEARYNKLREKLPNIKSINDDFLNVELNNQSDIITLLAVLTSITENEIRYRILKKALDSLSSNGMLVLYDYFDDSEKFLSENYRALSLSKVEELAKYHHVQVHKNVYIKSKYAKALCKIGLQSLIPLLESIRIFNDTYHFVVITNEK